ncbi:TetR/AcrR family transcriptional regulator [Streptomyces boncukensis]|uniref:Helix-turn-helix transcriptional regulator n=1 Tax=Streptomyces boncukensis TaxID=2711219 RepID=A0A6G4WQ55_9ACTN|nr:TetR/AcrR family transcriptional regulator [Streptomyces boncukensis]NGO67399.1 helix-turn-helix transcriptional regulator [Streptomyces boncukensis]
MAGTAPTEGRRERKKRETRERISDIATGMFLERGFEAVTIAEIAEAADVSVNTVYNYFPTKEDLFFDRAEEMTDRPAKAVREREPGWSAADAILGQMRQAIRDRSIYAGMMEGYDRFMRCIRESPVLLARLMLIQHRTTERLTETLRAETGAAPGDPLPELVASQLVGFSNVLFRSAVLSVADGTPVEEVAADSLAKLDAFETLTTDVFLNYATRAGG